VSPDRHYGVQVDARAWSDILETVEAIAADAPAAAENFLDAAVAGIRSLHTTPRAHPIFSGVPEEYAGVRKRNVPGFRRYLIFFMVSGDTVEVIRVLHGGRDLPSAFREML
jgi:toxin ParE1/3/4